VPADLETRKKACAGDRDDDREDLMKYSKHRSLLRDKSYRNFLAESLPEAPVANSS
jgi:hypothetical protein